MQIKYGRPYIETQDKANGKYYYVRWKETTTNPDGSRKLVKPSIPAGQVYDDAVKLRRHYEEKNISRQHGIPFQNRTVEEALVEFLEKKKRLAPATHTWYTTSLRKFREHYGSTKLADLLDTDLLKFEDFLFSAGHERNGIHMIIRVVRVFLRFCVQRRFINRSPAEGVEFQAKPEDVGRFATTEEIQAILTKGCEFNSELSDIIMVGLYTGMRLKNVLGFSKEWVRNGCIYIPRSDFKSRKTHVLPFHPKIMYIINRVKEGRAFKGWTKNRLERAWSRAKKRAGIVGRLRIHDWRHTCASWLIEVEGWSLEDVQPLLGHSSTKVTEKYRHLVIGRLKEKMSRVNFNVEAGPKLGVA